MYSFLVQLENLSKLSNNIPLFLSIVEESSATQIYTLRWWLMQRTLYSDYKEVWIKLSKTITVSHFTYLEFITEHILEIDKFKKEYEV